MQCVTPQPKLRCSRCREESHTRMKCVRHLLPLPPDPLPSLTGRFCGLCRKSGHRRSNCPQQASLEQSLPKNVTYWLPVFSGPSGIHADHSLFQNHNLFKRDSQQRWNSS
ncbi:hypothetical protein C8R44DRAFT_791409 [Mycena epipterygia]|nr:hypothetical protein C8R44DRAFT_791409 [Mycena epipterygia]